MRSTLLLLTALFLAVRAAPVGADLLVASNGLGSVERFDITTGAALDFVPPGSGGLAKTDGMTFGPDGDLYVCSEEASEVLRYDGKTGAFKSTFIPARSGGLDIAEYPVFGPDGNFYLSSTHAHAIFRYNGTTGAFIDAFVPPRSGGLNTPSGIVFGPDGNLYVASTETHQVLRYDGTTGAFKGAFVAAGSGGLQKPVDLKFGPDGNLYVVSISSSQVLRYRGSDGAFLDAFHTGLPLFNPTYLLFTPTVAPPPPPPPACVDDATHICLEDGRFRAEIAWQTPDGTTGAGQAVRLTADSAYFWFFQAGNVELIVKVLDGCSLNSRYWVFAGGLTNVATTLTVTDTQSGAVRTYGNPQGTAFAPLQDTSAFSICP